MLSGVNLDKDAPALVMILNHDPESGGVHLKNRLTEEALAGPLLPATLGLVAFDMRPPELKDMAERKKTPSIVWIVVT